MKSDEQTNNENPSAHYRKVLIDWPETDIYSGFLYLTTNWAAKPFIFAHNVSAQTAHNIHWHIIQIASTDEKWWKRTDGKKEKKELRTRKIANRKTKTKNERTIPKGGWI